MVGNILVSAVAFAGSTAGSYIAEKKRVKNFWRKQAFGVVGGAAGAALAYIAIGLLSNNQPK